MNLYFRFLVCLRTKRSAFFGSGWGDWLKLPSFFLVIRDEEMFDLFDYFRRQICNDLILSFPGDFGRDSD
jgi:hypothetical protein